MFDIISILKDELPRFKKVLELGSKKGEDLKTLDGYYEVIASESDKSKTRYLKDEFIDIRVILLDIITVDTHKKVDCIYSKNSFDSFDLLQINESLKNQKKILNENGLIFHIFDLEKNDKNEILTLINSDYEIIKSESSKKQFYVLAKLVDFNQ